MLYFRLNHRQVAAEEVPRIRTYGKATQLSKKLNFILGDKTNRSVSMRTAHGYMRILKAERMNEDRAEDIVHGIMVLVLFLLITQNISLGVFVIINLAILYHIGKKQVQP